MDTFFGMCSPGEKAACVAKATDEMLAEGIHVGASNYLTSFNKKKEKIANGVKNQEEQLVKEKFIDKDEPIKHQNGDIANGKDKEYKVEIKDNSEVEKLNTEPKDSKDVKDTAV